jgi:alpha-L-rhamnosidase
MVRAATITGLRCEHLVDPIGIDAWEPRLSWYAENTAHASFQSAYQIQVAATKDVLLAGEPDLWETGRVESGQSVLIPYKGRSLSSGDQAYWRVRIWDDKDRPLPWSEIATWEMGLLNTNDWNAQWIGRRNPNPDESPPCLYLRKSFSIRKAVKSCRLYMTARGVFEPWFNGERVGEDFFSPGWTEYDKRIEYCVYDISNQVVEGDNVVGAILGDGWYCGFLLFQNKRGHYGDEASLLGQVVIDYMDGTSEIVGTDDSWIWSFGALRESDIYHGEVYDAQLELENWCSVDFRDVTWTSCEIFESYSGLLVGKASPPVRVIDEMTPVSVTKHASGIWILDLGQNMVGQYRLKINTAQAGHKIQLRFGEMLQEDGSLYTDNLRQARATDSYTCRGDGEEEYQPRFTFHGYRYVEVSGYPGEFTKECFTGLVLHTQMEPTGSFECSDPLINKLHSNIVWGQKGNFLDIPTDCPQRDERLGWSGDAQVFVTTASFNYDVAAFFNRWLADMALAQLENGAVTDVIPSVMISSKKAGDFDRQLCMDQQGNAAWGDACVICPWVIYLRYDDKKILENSWEMMTGWIEFQRSTSTDLIRPITMYGDWLSTESVEPGDSPTPRDLIGTAYFAYTTGLVSRIATLLEKKEEAGRFSTLHQQVVEAFNQNYVDEEGHVAGGTQTAQLLALAFDLLPESKIGAVVSRLVQLVEDAGDHLSTGFVGTPLLCPTLTRFGRTDVAYKVLMQKTYPGWLYTVLNGATTMWERWNSWTLESGFGQVAMNSFNHYAYGAIGQWLYATVAGIDSDPELPGFKKIHIHPQPGGGLSYAKAKLKTPYGWVKSGWRIENGKFFLDLTIPFNTSALVTLPSVAFSDLLVNGESIAENCLRIEEESVGFTLKSGTFNISIPWVDSP